MSSRWSTSDARADLKRAKRVIAPGYLEEQTERVLVEARHDQRRIVYGAPHLRALIQISNASRPWPLYIHEAVAGKLRRGSPASWRASSPMSTLKRTRTRRTPPRAERWRLAAPPRSRVRLIATEPDRDSRA